MPVGSPSNPTPARRQHTHTLRSCICSRDATPTPLNNQKVTPPSYLEAANRAKEEGWFCERQEGDWRKAAKIWTLRLCSQIYREEKQPVFNLFNPLAPHHTFRKLLGAFRMRHEKHTQSSCIPEAFALPGNAAAADLMHPRILIF